jgi:hypothetical protein
LIPGRPDPRTKGHIKGNGFVLAWFPEVERKATFYHSSQGIRFLWGCRGKKGFTRKEEGDLKGGNRKKF